MRVRFRIPLLWTLLCAFSFVGMIACLVAWIVLLSGICLNPRAPDPHTGHVMVYSCHGMRVFITPGDEAQLHWLTPAGTLFMFISFVSGAMVARTAKRTLQRGEHAVCVRIFAVPPGEAPLWVREKWLGLALPIAQAPSAQSWRTGGVLTGPRGLASQVGHLLGGRLREQKGFAVNVLEAIAVLERASPEAAQWWRQNAAHMMTPSRHFVFPEEACALLPALDPPSGAAHFPTPPKE